jgi:hypothetical protein
LNENIYPCGKDCYLNYPYNEGNCNDNCGTDESFYTGNSIGRCVIKNCNNRTYNENEGCGEGCVIYCENSNNCECMINCPIHYSISSDDGDDNNNKFCEIISDCEKRTYSKKTKYPCGEGCFEKYFKCFKECGYEKDIEKGICKILECISEYEKYDNESEKCIKESCESIKAHNFNNSENTCGPYCFMFSLFFFLFLFFII